MHLPWREDANNGWRRALISAPMGTARSAMAVLLNKLVLFSELKHRPRRLLLCGEGFFFGPSNNLWDSLCSGDLLYALEFESSCYKK